MRIISGAFRGRTIHSATGAKDHARGYRPATSKVRQAVFSMLESRGVSWPEMRVLDLFAGSGSLGLEALSRGAEFAMFVESDKRTAGFIRRTLDEFGLGRERAELAAKDLFAVLRQAPRRPFDVVFIDPPYGRDLLAPALGKALEAGWMADGGFVLAEVEAGLDLDPAALNECLDLEADRLYGQTRILLWTHTSR